MSAKIHFSYDFLWNFVGSCTYYGTSFLYLVVVSRILGAAEAGVFAVAYAIAQILLTIGKFGMRTYHVTDINREYSFKDYGTSRLFTCVIMALISFVICWLAKYNIEKSMIVISTVFLKMVDAIEDVFHGEMQRNSHLSLAGKLLSVRCSFTLIAFVLFLLSSHNLLTTCVLTFAVAFLLCISLNLPFLKKDWHMQDDHSQLRIKTILLSCLPIFLATFFSILLNNLSKYAIDLYLSSECQTYYNILYMPTFAITLFSEALMRIKLPQVAKEWQGSATSIRHTIIWIVTLVIAVGAGTLIGGMLIGRKILEWVYLVNLGDYKKELVILLISGIFNAIAYVFYNTLISIRQKKILIIIYSVVTLVCGPLTLFNVKNYGIGGAATSTLLCNFLLAIVLFIANYCVVKNRRDVCR